MNGYLKMYTKSLKVFVIKKDKLSLFLNFSLCCGESRELNQENLKKSTFFSMHHWSLLIYQRLDVKSFFDVKVKNESDTGTENPKEKQFLLCKFFK